MFLFLDIGNQHQWKRILCDILRDEQILWSMLCRQSLEPPPPPQPTHRITPPPPPMASMFPHFFSLENVWKGLLIISCRSPADSPVTSLHNLDANNLSYLLATKSSVKNLSGQRRGEVKVFHPDEFPCGSRILQECSIPLHFSHCCARQITDSLKRLGGILSVRGKLRRKRVCLRERWNGGAVGTGGSETLLARRR